MSLLNSRVSIAIGATKCAILGCRNLRLHSRCCLGDNFYREQNFLEARETYSEGSRKLTAILDSVGDVFKVSSTSSGCI